MPDGIRQHSSYHHLFIIKEELYYDEIALFSRCVRNSRHTQTRMDVIGNNIANVNTVAYKSQSATFKDVYYQTTQTATGPNAESGKRWCKP